MNAVQTFDDWAKRGRAEPMGEQHATRATQALEAIPLQPTDRAIDLGCGAGWATRWLGARCAEAVGVDLAPTMLKLCRSTGGVGATYTEGSLTDLPFPDNSFAHAFSMEALYYVDVAASLVEAHRVLKPGGTLTVCVDFYQENPRCHSWPTDLGVSMAMLSTEGWREALKLAGFDVEEVRRLGESDAHAGTLMLRGRR